MRRIELTTVRTALGLALGLASYAAFAACSPSAPDAAEIETKFKDVLAAAQECDAELEAELPQSQCVIVFPGCPLGQFASVHRDKAVTVDERARALLREFAREDQVCAYGAPSDPVPVAFCREGTCDSRSPEGAPPPPDAGE